MIERGRTDTAAGRRRRGKRPEAPSRREPVAAPTPILLAQAAGIDPLLTAEEVAGVLGVRVDYIWSLCRADEIPHLCFGRTKRFRRSAIEEWLERREHGAHR